MMRSSVCVRGRNIILLNAVNGPLGKAAAIQRSSQSAAMRRQHHA